VSVDTSAYWWAGCEFHWRQFRLSTTEPPVSNHDVGVQVGGCNGSDCRASLGYSNVSALERFPNSGG